jgi:hypothetical protein
MNTFFFLDYIAAVLLICLFEDDILETAGAENNC